MPDTELSDRQLIALDLIRVSARDLRRGQQPNRDRALAHVVRAALRVDLVWRTICAATELSQGELESCLQRWPGDMS